MSYHHIAILKLTLLPQALGSSIELNMNLQKNGPSGHIKLPIFQIWHNIHTFNNVHFS